MLSVRSSVILIVLVVLGVVIYRLPARWITDSINVAGLDIDGVAGTIWSGQITRLSVNGEPVAPVRWSLRPMALLTGKVAADIEMFPRGGSISATLTVASNNQLTAEDVRVTGQLQHIAGGTALGPILGTIDAEFERIVVASDGALEVIGTAAIGNLQYPVNAPYGLGDFLISCDDTGGPPVTCKAADKGNGPVELAADLALGPQTAYLVTGRVRARPNAPREIAQGLRFLADPPDSLGYQNLRFDGSF